MPFIYQADMWCDECGKGIKDQIRDNNPAVKHEPSCDSDDFPQYCDAGESDGPQNCASGNCDGDEGDKYGTFLENSLTDDGYQYLKEMLDDAGPELSSPAQEWARYYGFSFDSESGKWER